MHAFKSGNAIKPSLSSLISHDLDELKVFKTKAVTIFAVVQFFMATALAFSSFFS